MKRPEGTVTFSYTFIDDPFDKKTPEGKIFEIVSGKHYFLLERTSKLKINFFHSSPGTGTRVASIDLSLVKQSKNFFFALVWSPNEIRLSLAPKEIENSNLVHAVGKKADFEFRITREGGVVRIGDTGLDAMGVRLMEGGQVVLEATAMRSWEETKETVKILGTGESKEGYIFDSIVANLMFPLMVTGFEVYAKRRFLELEEEGITPDLEKITKKMRSNISPSIQELTSTINFQDFKNECRRVYCYGYGIKFHELGLKSEEVEKLERIFEYRGRIIHNSSLLSMLNESLVPQEDPIFNNKLQALGHLNLLDKFIHKLHSKTLTLRKVD